MINLNDVLKEIFTSATQISLRSLRSGKVNIWINLISHQPDADKIYLFAKDSYKVKYQLLINNHKGIGLKEL